MNTVLTMLFIVHDTASAWLAKHFILVKRLILIVAHLSLFGFFFPELRKDFGEMAANLLIVILFLSPLSKIFRTRILLQLMGLRRELGITMAYLATVHGLGYMLDPEWFEIAIAPDLARGVWAVQPAFLAGGITYLLTLPLFLTSNNLAQRFLGGKWKMLHRLVYGVFIFAVFHRFLISGGMTFELIQAILLLSAYVLAKILAWKNFFPPLSWCIDWVASRYRAYQVAEKEKKGFLNEGMEYAKMNGLNHEKQEHMENEMKPMQESLDTPSEKNSVVSQGSMREALFLSGAVLLGSLIIAGSILTLAPQSGTAVVPTNNGNQAAAPTPTPEMDVNVVTSIDNDAVLGDKKKAKVAIVEFTDYECPFCKRFHADSFDTLVKDYVDTGKAVIVTRDFPLSFHDPKATDAAAVAECVRKEKGDAGYFAFAKAYYENTATNGKGLPAGKQEELIAKVGANAKTVAACALTDAVKQEIAKDVDDGGKIGVTGTPSFVIGTLAPDGTVTGERIVGALQTAGFKQKIDMFLSK